MIKSLFAIFAILTPLSVFAIEKPSEQFSYTIVARVCELSGCQIVDSSATVQALLKEDPNTPGNFSGEVKSTYSIKNFNFESKVQISQFAYGSNYQTNLFLTTTEIGSSVDHGSTEVIVNSIKELNSIAQYSTPFVGGNAKIEITLVIGSTPEAVLIKSKALSR
jgi:hypothetical protein